MMAGDLGSALERLWQVIEARRGADPQSSYTARLFARGRAKIAQKLGEEAVEAVIEGVADVGVSPADVAAELARREATSGIAEKRARIKTT
jgi:phosphoribosyl-ATP pyrophosphohydrolase